MRRLRRAKAGHFDRLATELQTFVLRSATDAKPEKGAVISRQEQFSARRAAAASGGSSAQASAKDSASTAAAAAAPAAVAEFGGKTKDSLRSMLQKEWSSILRKVELEQPIPKAKSKSKKRPPPAEPNGSNGGTKKKGGAAAKKRKPKGSACGGARRGGPVAPKVPRQAKRLTTSFIGMAGLQEGEEDLEGVDPETMPSPASQTVLRLLAAAAVEGEAQAQAKSNDPQSGEESGPSGSQRVAAAGLIAATAGDEAEQMRSLIAASEEQGGSVTDDT